MKTKIPEKTKLNPNSSDWSNAVQIEANLNLLIDYITELTTIIENTKPQGGWTDEEIKKSSLPDYYWFVNDQGIVSHASSLRSTIYEFRKKSGNVFKTEKEAVARRDEIIGLSKQHVNNM